MDYPPHVSKHSNIIVTCSRNQFSTQFDRLGLFPLLSGASTSTDFAHLLIDKNKSSKKTLINDYPIYYRYIISLKNEIKLAKINSKDRVLFVGSGPFPITAILIHELTHFQVDCVEINKNSAKLSKKVIDHLNHSDSINIINKDALTILIIRLL